MEAIPCPGSEDERLHAMSDHLDYVIEFKKTHSHIPQPDQKDYAEFYNGFPSLIKKMYVGVDSKGLRITYDCAIFRDKENIDSSSAALLSCSFEVATEKFKCYTMEPPPKLEFVPEKKNSLK